MKTVIGWGRVKGRETDRQDHGKKERRDRKETKWKSEINRLKDSKTKCGASGENKSRHCLRWDDYHGDELKADCVAQHHIHGDLWAAFWKNESITPLQLGSGEKGKLWGRSVTGEMLLWGDGWSPFCVGSVFVTKVYAISADNVYYKTRLFYTVLCKIKWIRIQFSMQQKPDSKWHLLVLIQLALSHRDYYLIGV